MAGNVSNTTMVAPPNRHLVEATARRIRGYAGRDPELRAILAELEGAVQELAVPMMEMERKQMYARSSYAMRSRMAGGQSMRGPDHRGTSLAPPRPGSPASYGCGSRGASPATLEDVYVELVGQADALDATSSTIVREELTDVRAA